jgi:transglutaminase superfamily protein
LNDSAAFARWRALSGADRARLLALALLLPMFDLSLRGLGLRRTKRLFRLDMEVAGATPAKAPTAATHAAAERLAVLAGIAGRRGLYPNSCLRQALAVQWWLRRRGVPAQLRIGGSVVDGSLLAHAWVELGGQALAQPQELPPQFS